MFKYKIVGEKWNFWTRLLVLVFLIFITWGFWSLTKTIIFRYGGKKEMFIISEIPKKCTRHNHISVLADGKKYTVGISRRECRDGTYKVGQRIELLKHDYLDGVVWPESRPDIALIMIMGIFIYVYFQERNKYRARLKVKHIVQKL